MYIRYFKQGITIHTAINGVYIRFWPTLDIRELRVSMPCTKVWVRHAESGVPLNFKLEASRIVRACFRDCCCDVWEGAPCMSHSSRCSHPYTQHQSEKRGEEGKPTSNHAGCVYTAFHSSFLWRVLYCLYIFLFFLLRGFLVIAACLLLGWTLLNSPRPCFSCK